MGAALGQSPVVALYTQCPTDHTAPLASLLWLWLGRGLDWACKVMYSCISPSKWQNAKPNAGYNQGLCSWLLSYLQAAPELSLKRGGGVKNSLPLIGVFGIWAVFLGAAVRPERGLLRFASQGHLNRRDAKDEGVIADQRSTIHQNLSNDGLEFF